jgi:hypothetical protein
MSTISEVKKVFGYEALNLNVVTTEEEVDAKGKVIKAGEKTDWLRMWDNDKRVSVVIHKDTLGLIQARPDISSLGIHTKLKDGPKGEFTVKTIVNYAEADVVL